MAQKKKQKKNGIDRRRLLVMVVAGVMALLFIVPMLAMILSAGAVTQADIDTGVKKDASALASQKKDAQSQLIQLQKDKNKALEQKNALDGQIASSRMRSKTRTSSSRLTRASSRRPRRSWPAPRRARAQQYETFSAGARDGGERFAGRKLSLGPLRRDQLQDFLDRVNFVSDVVPTTTP